jgi:hypothetical protein
MEGKERGRIGQMKSRFYPESNVEYLSHAWSE